jgi:oligopeptide transport system ATP-binding protein
MNDRPLLSISGLSTSFHTRNGIVRAVKEVSLSIDEGETVGIVGESGSGKSVLCQTIMGLVPKPTGHVQCDTMRFDGQDLDVANERTMRRVRGSAIALVSQDPMTALNPFLRIADQVAEPLIIHRRAAKKDAQQKALAALEDVGITDAKCRMRQYPHEFSGGMRQRVCIAMALITQPRLLMADEPTTALDVTIQAQILDMLRDIQKSRNLTIIFVTHNLGIVAGLCKRVVVMYAGRIVESATTTELFKRQLHPYTSTLLRSLPGRSRTGERLYSIPGQPPDPTVQLPGCPFAPRCEHVQPVCTESEVKLTDIDKGHCSACVRMQLGELK